MITIEELNEVKEKRNTRLYYEEKEYLQYIFLNSIAKYSDEFVFKGGTCLRICYGHERASEVLDLIKKSKMALEINHGGIRKCKAAFPSLWILKEAKKRNIPITLGIDAHYKEQFSNEIMEELIQIAKQAGYDSVMRFKNRKKIEENLI